jgi:hypothetical protein
VTTSWIDQAEAAMRGEPAPDIELYPGERAALFDAQARSAMLAPFMASFLWAAVIFRERLTHPLDPIALLLRLLALALSVRALILGVRFLRRLRVSLAHSRYALAFAEDGLLLRTPVADFALPKTDIIDIRQRGAWQDRGSNEGDVYVITRPDSGRTYVALPPLFARSPGVLAERLMRWRGAVQPPEQPIPREPAELPSKLFDAAATGAREPGTAVITQPRGYLIQRAPYATVLLGVTVLDGFLRLPVPLRAHVSSSVGLIVALCLGMVPLAYIVLERARVTPSKGIALLLTPAELLTRTRAGVRRLRFADLMRVEIHARKVWSILRGPHETRAVVLLLKDGEAVRYDEAGLSVPAEVVAALCDAYRKGLLP